MPPKTAFIAIAFAIALTAIGVLLVASPPTESPQTPAASESEAWASRVILLEGAMAERLDEIEARLRTLEEQLASASDPARQEIEPVLDDPHGDVLDRLHTLEARFEETLGTDAQRSVPSTNLRDLNDAIARGDLITTNALLAKGVDVHARDAEGLTPLAAAAIAGRLDMIDTLLEQGANLEQRSQRSMTPFLASLDAVQEDAALGLLDRGCDPNAVDRNGENGLIWASFNGCAHVVDRLLRMGSKVDHQSHDGGTALLDAVRKGHLDIVRVLLNHGADPNLARKDGTTPLALAIQKGRDEIAELLKAYGAE